jgi:hypothetical protein
MELQLDPPCCQAKCCKIICEENTVCSTLGRVGLKSFDKHRGVIMLSLAALAVFSVILSIVPIVSASFNRTNVQNTAWTYGESESGGKIWIGLNLVVVEASGTTNDFGWNSDTCDTLELYDDNFCGGCKTSCLESVTMVITNLITTFPSIKGNISRSTRAGDRNCEKIFSVITGIIGMITTLVALSVYTDVCGRNLPNNVLGQDVEYELGPGFVCLLLATLLKPFDILGNLLMPVIPEEESKEIKSSLL